MLLLVRQLGCLPRLNHNNLNHHRALVLPSMGVRWLTLTTEGWIGCPRIGSTRAIHPRETIRSRMDTTIPSHTIRTRTGICTMVHHLAPVLCRSSAWVTVSLRVEGYQGMVRVGCCRHCRLPLLLGCHLLTHSGLEVVDQQEVVDYPD